MTLTQIQYMIAVAEYGNFTIAAKMSNVTQPTLSMQVQKLEEELGVKIFNRNKKPIILTRIGQKILNQSKRIMIESNRMQDTIDREKGVVAGDFKLGIIDLNLIDTMLVCLSHLRSIYLFEWSKISLFEQSSWWLFIEIRLFRLQSCICDSFYIS